MSTQPDLGCPLPLTHDTVQLAHGGGGRLMHQLIEGVFGPAFDAPGTAPRHDSAVVAADFSRLAFTTDSYVVQPRFFPGGDIGKLAVYGTVNDLAMAGATPRWLSAGFIVEEGLSIAELRRVVASMQFAARACDVQIITGDTKVVDRGKADGVFINTAGIGSVAAGVDIGPAHVKPGDVVLASGDVGRHGIAVLSAREGIGFSGDIASDCATLQHVVREILDAEADVHCLRDLTRGGLASALNEIARDGHVDIAADETAVAVTDAVRGACEILGLDPLYVACEGRMVAVVAEASADRVLAIMRAHDPGAAIIGSVASRPEHRPGRVSAKGPIGGTRVLDLLSGEQLPRIC